MVPSAACVKRAIRATELRALRPNRVSEHLPRDARREPADHGPTQTAPPPTQGDGAVGVANYPWKGCFASYQSAISSNVTHLTPSCLLMCSMIRSCIATTCGRPDTSGWIVIVKTTSSSSR